ncbi:MRGRH protein, partial [Brachypteracias leptosomus]|nr:MRGRH protein [Brachypteracias leptosomus]
ETITTQPSLSFMTSIYVDYEGDTEYNCPRLPVRLMTLAGVSMGICLCGLVGNGILMRFLCFQLEQNPLTPYILNLAAADFSLLLVFSLLLSALLILAAFCLPNFIPFYLDFVFIIEFLCDFFDLSSLGLLAAISVERCMAVL